MRGRILAKQPKWLMLLTALVLSGLMIYRFFATPEALKVSFYPDMPLGQFIASFFDGLPLLENIVSILILLLDGILVARFINKFNVAGARTPFFFVVFILVGFGVFFSIDTVCLPIVLLLLILSSHLSVSSFKRTYTFDVVFKAAFYLGIIPLIYAPTLVLMAILPLTLWIYQRNAREWIVALVGVLLPSLFCSVAWWIGGYDFSFIYASFLDYTPQYNRNEFLSLFSPTIIKMLYLWLSLLLLTLLLTIISIARNFTKVGTRVKNIYMHFMLMSFLSVVMFFVKGGDLLSPFIFALPFTVVATYCFARQKGWIPSLLYVIIVCVAIVVNISILTH